MKINGLKKKEKNDRRVIKQGRSMRIVEHVIDIIYATVTRGIVIGEIGA